jgi:hypothetical protein
VFKTAAIALLCALSLFAVFDPGEARAKKPANSYTLECVLRSGCHFTCLAASGVKSERIFDKKNVKSVDFIEFGLCSSRHDFRLERAAFNIPS